MVECAMDVWGKRTPLAPPLMATPLRPRAIDDDTVVARKLLGAAEKPLIVVGGGAQDASAEVTGSPK